LPKRTELQIVTDLSAQQHLAIL